MIIGLFTNPTKKNALNLALKIKKILESNDITVVSSEECCEDLGCKDIKFINKNDIDYIIPIGGDGTILRLAHKYPNLDAPFFAINLGGLGFMADTPINDIYPCLTELIKGNHTIQERVMIQGNINDQKKCFSINEIALHRAQNPNIIDIAVYIDKKYLNTFSADGLIIATATGSTAYSLAAGGPIIYPELNALVITPISPHTISNRPFVFSSEQTIQIEYISKNYPIEVVYDGIYTHTLNTNEVLYINQCEKKFKLVNLNKHNYFSTLRQKLNWSGQIRNKNRY